jgi:hypothetical protein
MKKETSFTKGFRFGAGIIFFLILFFWLFQPRLIITFPNNSKDISSPTNIMKNNIIIDEDVKTEEINRDILTSELIYNTGEVIEEEKEIILNKIEAQIIINNFDIVYANLYPINITIINKGKSFIPRFEVKAYNQKGNEVCSGDIMDNLFNDNILPNQNKTQELIVLGCTFTNDGDYTLKVKLMDTEQNILDLETKDFEVKYWYQFKK